MLNNDRKFDLQIDVNNQRTFDVQTVTKQTEIGVQTDINNETEKEVCLKTHVNGNSSSKFCFQLM